MALTRFHPAWHSLRAGSALAAAIDRILRGDDAAEALGLSVKKLNRGRPSTASEHLLAARSHVVDAAHDEQRELDLVAELRLRDALRERFGGRL